MIIEKSKILFPENVEFTGQDARMGFFEPGGPVWNANRERVNVLGGLRAIMMQLAHPKIAQGVADHSSFDLDPIGRFVRTMRVIKMVLFSDRETAIRTARQVHRMHKNVRGELAERCPHGGIQTYAGTDPDLLLWVYATLIDSLIHIQTLLTPQKSPVDWGAFYIQGKTFAHLFGIPEEILPPGFADFQAYFEGMTGSLEVSATGKQMAERLLRLPHPAFGFANRLWAAGTLPAYLRRQFNLPWETGHERLFRAAVWAARNIYRVTPAWVRVSPGVRAAEQRYFQSK